MWWNVAWLFLTKTEVILKQTKAKLEDALENVKISARKYLPLNFGSLGIFRKSLKQSCFVRRASFAMIGVVNVCADLS